MRHEPKVTRESIWAALRIQPEKTAILVIDLQNEEISEASAREYPDYVERIKNVVVPNVSELLKTARSHGMEVIYTTIESLTADGRDRSLLHKLAKLNIPKGSWGGQVIPEIAPVGDEIVLPKTGSGVFNTTMLEYVLRNIGIEAIIVVGVLTDQCIDMALRDGADRGFLMICVTDGCTSYTEARHENALRIQYRPVKLTTTAELVQELIAAFQ
ncbi:isochorismatase family cysteine hydrolase [Bradyrhizobium arachidis]|uniref:Cysteine hydrolase n=1 Tax=Bradyrhizobium arachidis TaxID=858423 RepID=A0AAE7NJW8_9BRAD|nr:isochorismatase family cysteine hydrolase [Bradyrhizobium arachidis]QOZ66657.1 cysteine hydrolase [Bradyrhizobium arachidis]SFV17370.1 Nicotinamidase-related amidase [Bradyrhizobium arachidis]